MSIRGALLLCAGGLAIAAAGCGGGSGPRDDGGADATGDGGGGVDATNDGALPATCGNVQPCGGDVVGNWKIVETCESAASIAASKASFAAMAAQSWCVGQTLVGIDPEASGSLVLGGDGTYALAVVYGGYLDINYPASCIAGVSCDDATAGFQTQIEEGSFPMPNVSSISCAGTSSCLCRAAVNVGRNDTGTYSTSGNVLTFNSTLGIVNNKGYCVAGSALHIMDTAMGSAGQTVVDSDLVAMKP